MKEMKSPHAAVVWLGMGTQRRLCCSFLVLKKTFDVFFCDVPETVGEERSASVFPALCLHDVSYASAVTHDYCGFVLTVFHGVAWAESLKPV